MNIERLRWKNGSPNGRYAVNGLELPSVTTILSRSLPKPALVPWATRVGVEWAVERMLAGDSPEEVIKTAPKRPAEVAKEAADVGTQAHKAIEEWLRSEEFVLPADADERVRNCFRQFREFWDDQGFDLVDTELPVASMEHGYAGTLDCLAYDSEFRLVLLDWKTSTGIYSEMLLQAVAYATAVAEMGDYPPPERIIIARFGKADAAFEHVEIPMGLWDELTDQFVRCVATAKQMPRLEGWLREELKK